MFGTTADEDLQAAHDVDGCWVTGIAGTGQTTGQLPSLPTISTNGPSAFVSHTCNPGPGTVRFGNGVFDNGEPESTTWGSRVVDIGNGSAIVAAYVVRPHGAMWMACDQHMSCGDTLLSAELKSKPGFLLVARIQNDGVVVHSGAIGPVAPAMQETSEGNIGQVRNNLVRNGKGDVFLLAESTGALDLSFFDCPDLEGINEPALLLIKLDVDHNDSTTTSCHWGKRVR